MSTERLIGLCSSGVIKKDKPILDGSVDFDFISSNSHYWNLTEINDIEEKNDPGYSLSDTNWYLSK